MNSIWRPNVLREAGAAGAAGGGGAGAGAAGGGAGGAGAPAASWRDSLPDDIKADPSLKDIADIPNLAKSFVNAQKMIGTDKIAKPQKTWGDAQWAEFFAAGGRPESAEKYDFQVQPPEGVQIDEAKMLETKKHLHSLGLNSKQAGAAIKYYLDSIGTSQKALTDADMAAKSAATIELKGKWGVNYDNNMQIAQGVVKKFGSPELVAKLTSTGIGDDPAFIALFHQIGTAIMDDTAHGNGSGLFVGDSAKAKTEIDSLKIDPDFQKALLDRAHPGHKGAVERWEGLHQKAFPSK